MWRFPDCRDAGGGNGARGDVAMAGPRLLLPGAKPARGGEVRGRGGGVSQRISRQFRALPGVGRYTAGAIAAFAYDEPAALVDANIARVLARLFAMREAIDGPRAWRESGSRPRRSSRPEEPGGRAFNAGLMEIGALICTPRAPRCGVCPVAEYSALPRRRIAGDASREKTAPPHRASDRAMRAVMTRNGASCSSTRTARAGGAFGNCPRSPASRKFRRIWSSNIPSPITKLRLPCTGAARREW